MSTIEFDNNIYPSITGAKRVVDALLIESKLTKLETEWSAGTNTDFYINTGKITNVNTANGASNTIGTPSKTTYYGIGSGLTNIGELTEDAGHKSSDPSAFGYLQDIAGHSVYYGTGDDVPIDDSIPQNDEMEQHSYSGVPQSFTYTPKRIGNKLIITIDGNCQQEFLAGAGGSVFAQGIIGLAIGSDTDMSAVAGFILTDMPYSSRRCRGKIFLTYIHTVTSLDELTFKLYFGINSAATESTGIHVNMGTGIYSNHMYGRIVIEEYTQ